MVPIPEEEGRIRNNGEMGVGEEHDRHNCDLVHVPTMTLIFHLQMNWLLVWKLMLLEEDSWTNCCSFPCREMDPRVVCKLDNHAAEDSKDGGAKESEVVVEEDHNGDEAVVVEKDVDIPHIDALGDLQED